MADIWVISDTHFGHENIIQFCNRPFKNVYRMNTVLMDNWNSVVKPNDKVYHLGDVYFGGGFGSEYWDKYLSMLNGKKRLILGNHDNGKDPLLQKYFEKIDVWRIFGDLGLLLTHVPVHPTTLLEHPRRHAVFNVHGHTHEKGEPGGDTDNYKCVCVEWTDYYPIHLEELLKIAKSKGERGKK